MQDFYCRGRTNLRLFTLPIPRTDIPIGDKMFAKVNALQKTLFRALAFVLIATVLYRFVFMGISYNILVLIGFYWYFLVIFLTFSNLLPIFFNYRCLILHIVTFIVLILTNGYLYWQLSEIFATYWY